MQELIDLSPSESVWLSLRELFLNWPDREAKEQAITEAERKIEDWDDELRKITSTWRPIFSGKEANPFCTLVRTLEFRRHSQGATSILKKVAESPRFASLKHLWIINSDIEGYGFVALAKSNYLKNLVSLKLHKMVITDREMEILLNSPNLESLQHLKISKCDRTERDAELLVRTTHLENLEELDLSDNYLKLKDAARIVEAMAQKKLRCLRLSGNQITSKEELQKICPPQLKIII